MAIIPGMKLIVPTSVTGGSISATGKVTFSAETQTDVNGIFTSTYDNYMIVLRSKTTGGPTAYTFKFGASGTFTTGSDYTDQYLQANGTSIGGARSSSKTYGSISDSDNEYSLYIWYIYGPALAGHTIWRTITSYGRTTGLRLYDFAGAHTVASSYDSLRIDHSNGHTGMLTVYGLNQ